MHKEAIIEHLQTCSGNELIEILTRALAARSENYAANGLQGRLVVCEAHRLEDRSSRYDEGWVFCPLGDLNPAHVDRDTLGEPFLQSGQCTTCDVAIHSHVKAALCPLCGLAVSCT